MYYIIYEQYFEHNQFSGEWTNQKDSLDTEDYTEAKFILKEYLKNNNYRNVELVKKVL